MAILILVVLGSCDLLVSGSVYSRCILDKILEWSLTPWKQHSPWKSMVGRLVSFWNGLFSRAILVLRRVFVSINRQLTKQHKLEGTYFFNPVDWVSYISPNRQLVRICGLEHFRIMWDVFMWMNWVFFWAYSLVAKEFETNPNDQSTISHTIHGWYLPTFTIKIN